MRKRTQPTGWESILASLGIGRQSNGRKGKGTVKTRRFAVESLEQRQLLSVVWTGGGGSKNDWSNSANWANGAIPYNGADVVFPAGQMNIAYDDMSGLQLNSIEVGGSYELEGDASHPLSVAEINIDQNCSVQTGVPIAIDGSLNVEVASGATLTFANLGSGSGFEGSLSDDPGTSNNSLTETGAGTLTLACANNYSGDTIVSAGTLQIGSGGAIPSGPGAGNVQVDGTLDLNGYAVAVGGLSGSGTVTASTGACTLTVGANDRSSEFDGQIEDGLGTVALTKVGSGTLTLGGANSYIGGTTVSGGTLRVGNDDAIPSVVAASNCNVEVDGTLDLNGYSITVNGLTGSPSGLITTGVSGNCTLTVGANDQSSEFDGQIQDGAGTVALTKVGYGTLTLTGANTYSGGTTVSAGELATGELATSISVGGEAAVKDGASYVLALSGPATLSGWQIAWGDGTTSPAPGNATSATHTYPSGRNSYVITATASDGAETGIVQTTVSVLEMNTYYVAPVADGGSPINPGTLAAPMALPTAFADARAGDTIIMMGGTYGILADLSNGYGSVSALNHGGLPGAPLTIENYPGQQPVVDLGGYYPLGAGGWQQDPATGYWHVTLPSNSIAGGSPLGPSAPYYGPTVQIVGGYAASPIPMTDPLGSDGLPTAFTSADPTYYAGGQLAYDLTWYDTAHETLWFRSNQVPTDQITDPATQCAVVAADNQFSVSASWVTIDGLQVQDGSIAMHVNGEHNVVENCRVTHSTEQGILVNDPYGEIADNYVDAIGGELVYKPAAGAVERDWLEHDLYASGGGLLIHDNFLGRALSGSCAQVLEWDTTATTVFSNNVCYGAQMAGANLEGGNIIATGNVLIAPQLVWRGSVPTGDAAGCPIGIMVYVPQSNIILSGNYVEGAVLGLYICSYVSAPGGVVVPGLVVTHNTIAVDTTAGYSFDAKFYNGLPAVMNGNQWGGSLVGFSVLGQDYDYPDFLAWAQADGLEQQSAGMVTPTIDAPIYDQQLDANPTLAQAMALFRAYATAQINGYPPSAVGAAASEIGGTTTLDADGTAPQAANPTYDFSAGMPLSVNAAQGLLAGSEDPDGQPLAALLTANPAHGAVTVNADGSFVYTADPGYAGADSFRYLVSDGQGGTTVGTVTLLDPAPVGGFQVTAVAGLTSGPQTVATFACPGAVAADFTAVITWGDGHTSAGTITSDGNGGFIVSGSNTYAEQGSYTIGVTVGDASATTESADSTATVAAAPLTAVKGGFSFTATKGKLSGPAIGVIPWIDTNGQATDVDFNPAFSPANLDRGAVDSALAGWGA